EGDDGRARANDFAELDVNVEHARALPRVQHVSLEARVFDLERRFGRFRLRARGRPLFAARSSLERGELGLEALALGARAHVSPFHVVQAGARDGAARMERSVTLEVLLERALRRERR